MNGENPEELYIEGLTKPDQVMQGLNLIMQLEEPNRMRELISVVEANTPTFEKALADIGTIHFARFLPIPSAGLFQVITVYDGEFDDYLREFASRTHNEFTAMLKFMVGRPPLPVVDYQKEFIDYVRAHDFPAGVWSAYPRVTVQNILAKFP